MPWNSVDLGSNNTNIGKYCHKDFEALITFLFHNTSLCVHVKGEDCAQVQTAALQVVMCWSISIHLFTDLVSMLKLTLPMSFHRLVI